MSFVEGMLSQYEHFTAPIISRQTTSSHKAYFIPVSPIAQGQPLEIVIPPSEDYFTDLSRTRLYVKGKVLKDNGANLVAADDIYPVNNFLHSLFKQVDCMVNEKLVSRSAQTYAYKAYLEKLFNYGRAYKETTLSSVGWIKDDADTLQQEAAFVTGILKPLPVAIPNNPAPDAAICAAKINELLTYLYDPNDTDPSVLRGDIIRLSAQVEMTDKPHLDIFNTDRYLLNNVGLKLKFIPNDPKFYLMQSGQAVPPLGAYFQISEFVVEIVRVKPSANLMLAETAMLQSRMASYKITHTDIKIITIYTGAYSLDQDNVFLNNIPNRIIMGFVDVDAMEGSWGKNPYNFKHVNISYLAVYIDGIQVPPKPYKPDFPNNRYLQSYVDTLDCVGKWGTGKDIDMARTEFKNGFTLFAIDLTSDLSINSDFFHPSRTGSLRVEIHFSQGLARPQNLLIYGETDHIMNVDSTYNVAIDY